LGFCPSYQSSPLILQKKQTIKLSGSEQNSADIMRFLNTPDPRAGGDPVRQAEFGVEAL